MNLLRNRIPASFLGFFAIIIALWPMMIAAQCRAMCLERAATTVDTSSCPAVAPEQGHSCCHQGQPNPVAASKIPSSSCCTVLPDCPLAKPLFDPQVPAPSGAEIPPAVVIDVPLWMLDGIRSETETHLFLLHVLTGPDPPTQESLCTYRC